MERKSNSSPAGLEKTTEIDEILEQCAAVEGDIDSGIIEVNEEILAQLRSANSCSVDFEVADEDAEDTQITDMSAIIGEDPVKPKDPLLLENESRGSKEIPLFGFRLDEIDPD